MSNAIGLDVGTHMLVVAKNNDNKIEYNEQIDAFFTMDVTEESKQLLDTLDVPYIEKRNKLAVLGEPARKFANMFQKETRRPMQTGCLNKGDLEARTMIGALLYSMLGEGNGQYLVYSCTSKPLNSNLNFDYHQSQIEAILKELNYDAKPIQEARAIALAELSKDNFTGIAISFGSGTTTVWMGLFGMDNPKFQFSIDKGGDWIDENAASNFEGLTKTKVQTVKERGILIKGNTDDLDSLEGNKLLEAQAKVALSVYYRMHIQNVLKGIKQKLESEQLPEFDASIPIVIAGGTSAPKDFLEVFNEELEKIKLPVDVSEVRQAQDPFKSVAKGCLISAQLEEKRKQKK